MKTSAREEANDFVIKLFDKLQKQNLVGEMVFSERVFFHPFDYFRV